MGKESLETVSLDMLQRIKIRTIAEKAFKKGVEYPEGLESGDLEYISNLGGGAEKVFYECIQSLKNKQKFPTSILQRISQSRYANKKRY